MKRMRAMLRYSWDYFASGAGVCHLGYVEVKLCSKMFAQHCGY
jgi:hypothetical protein